MTPLTFTQCAGDVLWQAGGPAVFMTPAMILQIADDLKQAGIDAALFNDIDQVRQATQLLNQLEVATRSAMRWRQAAQVMA